MLPRRDFPSGVFEDLHMILLKLIFDWRWVREWQIHRSLRDMYVCFLKEYQGEKTKHE